ncbi:hypothetical protein [Sphingobium indicum]
MAEILTHPAKPVRAWVVFPDGDLWGAKMIGFGALAAAYPPPEAFVSFDCIMSVMHDHQVRMGLPIIVNPAATALGGAA